MHIISHKRIKDFEEKHSDLASALDAWYRTMKKATFSNFAEMRSVLPSADLIRGTLHVFNIGGNSARVIADVHYADGVVLIRAILTHAEYNKGQWK